MAKDSFSYPLCKFNATSRKKLYRKKSFKVMRSKKCKYNGQVPRCVSKTHAICAKKPKKKSSSRRR